MSELLSLENLIIFIHKMKKGKLTGIEHVQANNILRILKLCGELVTADFDRQMEIYAILA